MECNINGDNILRRTAYRNASNKIREIIKTITETAEKQAKSKPECSIRRTRQTLSKSSLGAKRRKHLKPSSVAEENENKKTASTTTITNQRRKRENLESKSVSGQDVRELKRIKSNPGSDDSPSPETTIATLTPTQDTMTIAFSPMQAVPLAPLALDFNGNKLISNDPELNLQLAVLADCDGDRPIHLAVLNGDVEIVNRLIELMQRVGVPIDMYNYMKQTPLHIASIVGDATVASTLLTAGANAQVQDRTGNNCIHLAVKYNRLKCLVLLLEELKDKSNVINSVNYEGYTPLHLAVIQKNESFVKQIISVGADIDILDRKSGKSSLHLAVLQGNLKMTQELLNLNADVSVIDYAGNTPLMCAQERGLCRITNLLEKRTTIKKED